MKKSRKCGGCQWFMKRKNDQHSGGICDFWDYRTNTDSKCDEWKGIPYDRKLNKKMGGY